MANWNTTITLALVPGQPQIGTPGTTTSPTLIQATQEWERLGPIVSIHARAAGLSGTVADWSDDGLTYFRQAEAYLAASRVLELKGTALKLGADPDDFGPASAVLWARGMAMLSREELGKLGRGLVSFTGAYLAADPRIASDWTLNKDPNISDSPTDDRAYARAARNREDEDL